MFAQFVLFLVIGVMLFTYYQHTPLPRPLGRTDEVLPLFVVTSLPQGVAGFIVAAIVAAALSPSINSLAATTVNDFYLKYVRPDADEDTLMRVARQATIGWGVAQIAVALGAQWVTRSVLDSGLSVLSLAAGPVLGAFLIGVLTTRVEKRRDAGRHGRRRRRARVGLVDRRLRLHLVRADRRGRDERRGAPALVLPIANPGWPSDFDVVANDAPGGGRGPRLPRRLHRSRASRRQPLDRTRSARSPSIPMRRRRLPTRSSISHR